MEKRKEKADLEQLLNSLIEKGWLPRGDKNWESNTRITNIYFRQDENGKLPHIRMIVSKESNLWQFVCENGMTTLQIEYNNRKPPERGFRYHWNKHSNAMQENERLSKERKRNENYEYRLIESALKDESELEDFLLNSIKLD